MGFGRWPLRLTSGPATPENFTVELTATSNVANFNITWTNTETPESYNIYYKTNAAATFTKISGITSSPYSFSSGLLNNTSYNIYITAVNSGRESGKTATITQTFYLYPVKPTYTFSYEHLGYTISWPANASSTRKFIFDYSVNGSSTIDKTGELSESSITSYNFTNYIVSKSNGQSYKCNVKIKNGPFETAELDIGPVSGTPFADGGNSTITIYSKPNITNVVLTPTVATTSVSITVNTSNTSIFPEGTSIKSAGGYKLYNGTTLLSTTNSSSISRTGLTVNTNYTFGVSLVNNFGIESDKKTVSFKTLNDTPTQAPTLQSSTIGTSRSLTVNQPTETISDQIRIYQSDTQIALDQMTVYGTYRYNGDLTFNNSLNRYVLNLPKNKWYAAKNYNSNANKLGPFSNLINWTG